MNNNKNYLSIYERAAIKRTITSRLCKRVTMQRHFLNLSQQRLAKIARVSQSTIAQIESGKKLPSLETLIDIAYALKLKPENLIQSGWGIEI